MKVKSDPIRYVDEGDWRNIDLRRDGVDCVPLFGMASIKAVSSGANMHIHLGCIEFCLCVKGNLRYVTTEGEYQVRPGQLFVSQPNMAHRRCNNPKGMRLYQILFKVPPRGGTVLGLTPKESACLTKQLRCFPYRLCPSSSRVNTAFERLFKLHYSTCDETTIKRLNMKAAALELFLALTETPRLPASGKGRPNVKLNAIIERMNDHPDEDFPIAQIAAEAALSPGLLTDAFKRATGLTPHAYLLDVRVKHAREDLMRNSDSVAAIAKRYNFPTARHFSSVFKRIVGSSPREYREKT